MEKCLYQIDLEMSLWNVFLINDWFGRKSRKRKRWKPGSSSPVSPAFKVLMWVLGLTRDEEVYKAEQCGQGLVSHVKHLSLFCIHSLLQGSLTSRQNCLSGWNLSLGDEFLLQVAPRFSLFLLPTSDSWGNFSSSKTIFSATWQLSGTEGISLRYLYSWQLPGKNCTFSVFVYSEPSTRPENSWCLI